MARFCSRFLLQPRMKFYKVGGCVRDELLGIAHADVDYAVEDCTLEELIDYLRSCDYEILSENERLLSVKARKKPDSSKDFTLCRSEGAYAREGTMPSTVQPATLETDLQRRDFTINAIAKDADRYVDPFGGAEDLKNKVLRCVGSAQDRFEEDPVRLVRAVRFMITLDMVPTEDILECFASASLVDGLERMSLDKRRAELAKCFAGDSAKAIVVMASLPAYFRERLLHDMWLKPTLRTK